MPTFHLPYQHHLIEKARKMRKNPTPAEKQLWQGYLRNLPIRVLRQKPIDRFIVDFYCATYKIAIEVNEQQHYTKEGLAYDAERSAILSGYGIKIIRFTNKEVINDFDAVCEQINYFELTLTNLPDNKKGILDRLTQKKLINIKSNEYFDITNLGAVLFAKKLTNFERLGRKAIRVILYSGDNRIHTQREELFDNNQLPQNEQIGQALRQNKVVDSVEIFQLSAPDFRVNNKHTQAILFAYRELREMDKSDRIRACYQHACLRFVSNKQMTNESLRKRFAIDDKGLRPAISY